MAIDSHAVTGLTGSTSIGKACLFTFVRLDVHVLYTCYMRLDSDVYYIYSAGGHVVPRYAFTRCVSERWRVLYTLDPYNALAIGSQVGTGLPGSTPRGKTCLHTIRATACACYNDTYDWILM
jgi:hypothetical protein